MKFKLGSIALLSLLTACDALDPAQKSAQECAENYISKLAKEVGGDVINVKATNIRKVPGKDIIIHDIESEVFINKTNSVINLPKKDFQCYTTQEEYKKYQQRIADEKAAQKARNDQRIKENNERKARREATLAIEAEERRIANEKAAIKRKKEQKKQSAIIRAKKIKEDKITKCFNQTRSKLRNTRTNKQYWLNAELLSSNVKRNEVTLDLLLMYSLDTFTKEAKTKYTAKCTIK